MKNYLNSYKRLILSQYSDERLKIFYETQWKPIAGAFLLSSFFAVWYYERTQDSFYIWFWLSYQIISVFRLISSKLYFTNYQRFSPITWHLLFNAGMLIHGVIWSIFGIRTSATQDSENLVVALVGLIGVVSSNLISYPSSRLSHFLYPPLVLIPFSIGLALSGQKEWTFTAFLLIFIFVPIITLASMNNFRLVVRLLSESAEKGRMENELKTAQTVQNTLFPESSASMDGIDVAGYYEPAFECGGDWWYYSRVGDKVYLWIGDATGHGVPAALLTSAARSASSLIESLGMRPAQALELLNRAIYEVSKGQLMMTFFLATIDTKTRELVYSNASHEPPILLRADARQTRWQELTSLSDNNNIRLGEQCDTKYTEQRLQLHKDDMLLFYTDGLTDAADKEQRPWGLRSFLKLVVEIDQQTPEKFVASLVSGLKDHRAGALLKDDVSIMVAKAN